MLVLPPSRKLLVAAALCAALSAAQAQEAEAQARTGAIADSVSSVIAVAARAAVSPVLAVAGLVFKAVTLRRAESLPETERANAYALAAASWQGNAAGNACLVATAASGGVFLPGCLAVGVAWGWKTWADSERERRAAERCAVLRIFTGKPKMPCSRMPKGIEQQAAAPPRPVTLPPHLMGP